MVFLFLYNVISLFFFLLINLLALFLFCIFLSMTLKANEMVRLCKINVALGPKVVLF